jgi:hypothetical protein
MNKKKLNNIISHIEKTYYSFARYGVSSTFALLYHEHALPEIRLRTSDHLINLDKHHYFITFSHTTTENAHKAAQNLLLHLDSLLHSSTTTIVLDTFNTSHSPKVVLDRLHQILQEARQYSFSRIEDESALDRKI